MRRQIFEKKSGRVKVRAHISKIKIGNNVWWAWSVSINGVEKASSIADQEPEAVKRGSEMAQQIIENKEKKECALPASVGFGANLELNNGKDWVIR